MSRDDGGPAFPGESIIYFSDTEFSDIKPVPVAHSGMTLRDYFAAKAMAAILVADGVEEQTESMAFLSYAMADAMLEERAK